MVTVVSTAEELRAAQAIRHRVFVLEQGISEDLEQDGDDDKARHVLAFVKAEPVGTGRVILKDDGEAVLSRIAVLPAYRNLGLGRAIVRTLERIAVAEGATRASLQPHDELEAFYEALGYTTVPGTSTAGTHRLIKMQKQLSVRNA